MNANIVIGRYLWRRFTWLPDWAPTLTEGERTAVHWIERVLYLGMFVQPISGYLFVIVFKHQLFLRDRLLHRMLPFTHQS